MVARRPTAFDEAFALDDVYDEPATEAWDEGERASEGPLRVCLFCGASPPLGSGCEHPLVAALEQAPADVVAAAQRLAIAARAYHECERVLRRLVTREQEAGRAELISPPPRPLPPVKAPPAPEASAPPCPRCGFPDAPPAPPRPSRRGAGKAVAQTLFAFANTTPPAAEPADATPTATEPGDTTTPATEPGDTTPVAAESADTASLPDALATTDASTPADATRATPPIDERPPASHTLARTETAEAPADEPLAHEATTAPARTRRSKRGRPPREQGGKA